MALSTADWVVIGVAIFNTIIVPGSVLLARNMVDATARKHAGEVKKALETHESHDDHRFQQVEDAREKQHEQNQGILHCVSKDLEVVKTDVGWLKSAMQKKA
jgi:hypothetical protein